MGVFDTLMGGAFQGGGETPQMSAPPNPLLSALQPPQDSTTPSGNLNQIKDLQDTILEKNPAHAILLGMLEKGYQPEEMTKGQVARNALANFARGALMGRDFKPV